ncbi:hypothetical protein EDD15DRAFT_2199426 [Pisolithus albus]|nr:hypothetical protein EDD15DRAFT_2199426 [Pisolithus albus]
MWVSQPHCQRSMEVPKKYCIFPSVFENCMGVSSSSGTSGGNADCSYSLYALNRKQWMNTLDTMKVKKGHRKGRCHDVVERGGVRACKELLAYPHQLTAHVRRMPQIRGFQISLKANPELHGKVVLTQVAVRTTKSNELVRGVSDDLARVIAAFSTLTYQPVVFLHFALCRGTVFGREYLTGTCSCFGFRSCFAVNPYDARGTTKAIYQGSVTSFLIRYLRACTEHALFSIDPSLVLPLDLILLILKYRHPTTRFTFVDLEGYLWVRDMSKSAMIEMITNGKGPMVQLPEATMRMLERMAGDPKNEIWTLSRETCREGSSVGIVAEKGCFVNTGEIDNMSSGQSDGTRWINMVVNSDKDHVQSEFLPRAVEYISRLTAVATIRLQPSRNTVRGFRLAYKIAHTPPLPDLTDSANGDPNRFEQLSDDKPQQISCVAEQTLFTALSARV